MDKCIYCVNREEGQTCLLLSYGGSKSRDHQVNLKKMDLRTDGHGCPFEHFENYKSCPSYSTDDSTKTSNWIQSKNRISIKVMCELKINGRIYAGYISDINKKGAFVEYIQSRDTYPLSFKEVELSFDLKAFAVRILKLSAEVVHQEKEGFGINFKPNKQQSFLLGDFEDHLSAVKNLDEVV